MSAFFRARLVVTALFAFCALAPACHSSSSPSPAVADTTKAAKPIKIAMIAKSSTNPVFLSARRGAETAAKDLAGRIGVPI